MTDTAGPFDGAPWAEAQWARHAATWAPSGVYGPRAASTTTGDLPLSVSGLSVGLGAGRAWVRGFGFERTGAAVMQAVTANTHASFSRRDRIVLRRNLATHTITPVLLTGTPSGTPAAPALTQSDAGSWDIPTFSFLVPPNSGTAITGLVDERVWIDPNGGGIASTPQKLIDAPGAGFFSAPGGGTLHPSRTIDPAALFGAGVGALVMVDAQVLLDSVASAATKWDLSLYVGATMMDNASSGWSGRATLQVTYTDVIAAGSTATYSTKLEIGTGAGVNSYGDPRNNRAQYTVFPL